MKLLYLECWNHQRCGSKPQKSFLTSWLSMSLQEFDSLLLRCTSILDILGFVMSALLKLVATISYNKKDLKKVSPKDPSKPIALSAIFLRGLLLKMVASAANNCQKSCQTVREGIFYVNALLLDDWICTSYTCVLHTTENAQTMLKCLVQKENLANRLELIQYVQESQQKLCHRQDENRCLQF